MRVNDDQQGGYHFSTDAAAGLISCERDEERNWGSCRRWCQSFQKKTPEAIAQSLSHWGRWEFHVALAACSLVYFTSEGWSWVILLRCNLIMNKRLPVINNVLFYDLSLDCSPFYVVSLLWRAFRWLSPDICWYWSKTTTSSTEIWRFLSSAVWFSIDGASSWQIWTFTSVRAGIRCCLHKGFSKKIWHLFFSVQLVFQ